jgi:hypothetical protein
MTRARSVHHMAKLYRIFGWIYHAVPSIPAQFMELSPTLFQVPGVDSQNETGTSQKHIVGKKHELRYQLLTVIRVNHCPTQHPYPHSRWDLPCPSSITQSKQTAYCSCWIPGSCHGRSRRLHRHQHPMEGHCITEIMHGEFVKYLKIWMNYENPKVCAVV